MAEVPAATVSSRSALDAFVRPSGIAIVGASDDLPAARDLIRNLVASGYPPAGIFPVHPRYRAVRGLRCVPDLRCVDGVFDLVVVLDPGGPVTEIVRESGRLGATGVLLLGDGAPREDLVRAAADAGVGVLGPETLGFLAPPGGVGAWAGGRLPRRVEPGGIGLVAPSGEVLDLLVGLASHRGLGVSAAFSAGASPAPDTADLVGFLADDDRTRVVAVAADSAPHRDRMAGALRAARAAGTHVVLLELGPAEPAWTAELARCGVVLAGDYDELVDGTALLDRSAPVRPAGPARAALVTASRADLGLLAGVASRVGLPLADLGPATLDVLSAVTGRPVLAGDPVDVEEVHRADPLALLEAVDVLCAHPDVDVVGVRLDLPSTPTDRLEGMYRDVASVAGDHGVLPVVLGRAAGPLDRSWFEFFAEVRVPLLPSVRPALVAIGAWCAAAHRRG